MLAASGDAFGQGYGIEAVSAVVQRALYVRGLPRVSADVDPRNVASLKLLGRLGFVETGRFEAAPGWGKSAAFV